LKRATVVEQAWLARNLVEEHRGDWHRLSARIGIMQALNRHHVREFNPKLPARDAGNRLELAARVLMLPPR
jgi:hypothetical protein